jgi:hypothetical protein
MTVYNVSIAEAASAADHPAAEAHFYAGVTEAATAVDSPSTNWVTGASATEAATAVDHPRGGWGVSITEAATAVSVQALAASFHVGVVETANAQSVQSTGSTLTIAHEAASAADHPSAQVVHRGGVAVVEAAAARDSPSAVLVPGGVAAPLLYDYPFFFAWIAPTEVFSPTIHNREDVEIISFDLSQREGEFALLSVEIKNPRIGLLNPGRLYWTYFSWYNGTEIVLLFKGRLIAVPNNIFAERATIEFTARPLDYLAQQQAIALGIMNAGPPNWDPAFISPEKRLDPDTSLEALSVAWAIDRVSGVVSTSNFLVGEDGTLVFTADQGLYYSVRFTIDKPPARSVYCNSTVTWQQRGTGVVDMGTQTILAYSGESIYNDWPKPLTSIGGGWSVEFSSVFDNYNTAKTDMVDLSYDWQNTSKTHHFGDTMKVSVKWTKPYFRGPYQRQLATAFVQWAQISTNVNFVDTPEGISRYTDVWVPQWSLATQLQLRWEAKRDRTENARFTLVADLQPVFTDPGGEAANFAQDSELLEINGKVGLEGPYGQWQGEWAPDTTYSIYDYFTVMIAGYQYTYQATRNHVSLSQFDISTTATLWQPDTQYAAGENVWVSPSDLVNQDVANALKYSFQGLPSDLPPGQSLPPVSFASGWVYAVLLSHTSQGSFNPDYLDANGNVIYDLRVNPFSGKPMYQAIPSFRGLWTPGTVYAPSDMFIPPSPYTGLIMKVIVGHTSAPTFTLFDTDPTGRLLYAMLMNPPIIGDLLSREYFSTSRGNLSLQYLILKGEAMLDFRSRCARTTFEVPFAAAASSGISCRMSAQISDGRLPGGVALGKIVEYHLRQKEESPPMCEIQIASAPGNGGVIPGGYTPVGSGAVGYTPPASFTVDDGLVFPLTKTTAVISETLQTSSPAQTEALLLAVQAVVNQQQFNADLYSGMNYNTAYYETESPAIQFEQQAEAWAQALASTPTWYELVLNPVDNGPFAIELDIIVTSLKIDMQINLAAPSTA